MLKLNRARDGKKDVGGMWEGKEFLLKLDRPSVRLCSGSLVPNDLAESPLLRRENLSRGIFKEYFYVQDAIWINRILEGEQREWGSFCFI